MYRLLKFKYYILFFNLIIQLPPTSYSNNFDKSIPPLPYNYEYLTWDQKQHIIWNQRIVKTEYKKLPRITSLGWFGILKQLKALVTLNKTFSHSKDELPKGRQKIIHGFGSTALVEFIPSSDTPYTGIFTGAKGLVRIGLAGSPKLIGIVPGMAIKFFISGRPSLNIQVMNSLNGQGNNKNIFAYPFSNSIPNARGLILRMVQSWFSLFVKNPTYLSINHLASLSQDGEVVKKKKAPYQIKLIPTNEVQIDENSSLDFRKELSFFPIGTVLYRIWARRTKGDNSWRMIGKLVTLSPFVSSYYGDNKLFFQHHR